MRRDEEIIHVKTKAVNELGNRMVSAWGAISQQAGRVISPGAPSGTPPTLVPLLPQSPWRAHKIVADTTRLASVLLIPLLSYRLTALKRKDMSTCLLWMSPWPYISARPWLSDGRQGRAIRPEPHLHSLDAATRRLDKRLRRCTLWLCPRSSRPSCSPVRKPVWMQLHSAIWGAGQTWLYAPPKPPLKPSGVRYPAW